MMCNQTCRGDSISLQLPLYVSKWSSVMSSYFGDCYRIYCACEFVYFRLRKNSTKALASSSHSSKSERNTDWELKRNTNPRQHISLPESWVSDKITELLDPRLSRDFTGNRVSSAICRSLPDLLLPQHTTPHTTINTQHQHYDHYTMRDVLNYWSLVS